VIATYIKLLKGELKERWLIQMKFRFLAVIMAVVFLLLTPGTAAAGITDIDGHWAQEEISNWVADDLIAGFADGSFRPDQEVTRAQFVALVNRAFNKQTTDAACDFADIKPSDWFYYEVASAKAAGYISGFPDGSFRPNKEVTRQEAAAMITKLLDLKAKDESVIVNFKDYRDFSKWAEAGINAVVAAEIMSGFPDGTFGAQKFITRAETVVTLDRALIKFGETTGITGVVTMDNVPVKDAVVRIFATGGREVLKEIVTGKDGKYDFTLHNGEYDITAVKGKDVGYAGGVTVQQGITDIQEIKLDKGVKVSGVLLDKRGKKLVGVKVFFTTNPVFIDYAGNNGAFSVVLPAVDNEGQTLTYAGYFEYEGTSHEFLSGRHFSDDTDLGELETSVRRDSDGDDDDDSGSSSSPSTGDEVIIPPGYNTPPELQSISVTGASISLFYNEPLDESSVPKSSDYSVTVNNALRAVTMVGISGSTVTLTLETAVQAGAAVSINYVSGSNPVRDNEGNNAGSFSNQPANNTTIQVPEMKITEQTSFKDSTSFLYSGSNAVQTGVAAGTINSEQAAVLRGRVLARDGSPLSGVKVTILDRSEFGSTSTRADGMFDLAVNGGSQATVQYEKDGFLSAQRSISVPLKDYAWLPDVVMLPYDKKVTSIKLEPGASMQVAQGSPVTDKDGTRQATLIFPQHTTAEMILPDGSSRPLTSLNVRATEYTVGPNGPQAMPADLPTGVGYTHAVEFSVDEAVAAGATDVRFNQPVYHYVENFLDFPVGGIVPVGYYDREQGKWIPSDNGCIIQILSINDEGLAELDVKGDGIPANAGVLTNLNITAAERQKLAKLYRPGQSLWRVPITHFTPWDENWASVPPEDAEPPDQPEPEDEEEDDPCEGEGSIIEYQNQVLGESAQVYGTPFSLHYRSDRTPAHKKKLNISLTGQLPPGSAKTVELDIVWMGQHFTMEFPNKPNQWYSFLVDDHDAYGRQVSGTHPANVQIGYKYDARYVAPEEAEQSFGRLEGTPMSANIARAQYTLFQQFKTQLSKFNPKSLGLGGWTLNVHHTYDPASQMLFLGNGSDRKVEVSTSSGTGAAILSEQSQDREYIITTVKSPASGGALPMELAMGKDGTIYFSGGTRVWELTSDGRANLVAGTGEQGHSGDGGPATEATFRDIKGIDVGSDGSIFIADMEACCIRRVDPEGNISTVAGIPRLEDDTNGDEYNDDINEDGRLATETLLIYPMDVAVGPDGSLYIAEQDRIRKTRVGGLMDTVSDTLEELPMAIDVDAFGNVYTAGYSQVFKVDAQGNVVTVAGTGERGYSGDGPAQDATFEFIKDIAVAPNGGIYIVDGNRIRQVLLGNVTTVVNGSGEAGYNGDDIPALMANLYYPTGIQVGNDGSYYIADAFNLRIRKVALAEPPSFGTDNIIIPSQDKTEAYIFSPEGRHLRTVNALTGGTKYSFGYDSEECLISVTDGSGNVTQIMHNDDGDPTAIIAPGGLETGLSTDENGFLSGVTCPLQKVTRLEYTDKGLLTSLTDHKGNVHRFTYNDENRLIKDEDPAGGYTTLTRSDLENGHEISVSTAMGRTSIYQIERHGDGSVRHINIFSSGNNTVGTTDADGNRTVTYSDGTETEVIDSPDSRWGNASPLTSTTITTPGGLKSTITQDSSAELSDPDDPLSINTLTNTVSINGKTYTDFYDASSRKVTSTTPEGRQVVYTLNNLGRVVKEETDNFEPVIYGYDNQGHLETVEQGNRRWFFIYDDSGNLTTLINPLGQQTGYQYDAAGRLEKTTLPSGKEILYGYDGNGNLTSITTPGRTSHNFEYSPVNLKLSYSPPSVGDGSGSKSYIYNDDRQLLQATVGGDKVSYVYSDDGRLNKIVLLPYGSVDYKYNEAGLLSSVSTADVSDTFYYDGSLITGASVSGSVYGDVRFDYNNDLLVSAVTVNGDHKVNFQYDNDGLMTAAGALTIFRDNQSGLITGTELGNVDTAISYNDYGELKDYKVLFKDSAIYSINYEKRDKLGGIKQTVMDSVYGERATFTYSYGPSGYLEEEIKNGQVSRYSYDDNGNLESFTREGKTINATYDAQDRLLRFGPNNYSYNDNGSLRSKTDGSGQTTSYDYDVFGNLRSVQSPGETIEYLIDGNNRRIGKSVNGSPVQRFLYRDSMKPVAELDGSNNLITRFIYATRENVPDYMVKNNNTYRIISDHLGSPRMVVDSVSGAVYQEMDYDAFGNVIQDTNPGFQPFGFAGGIYDRDTGLTRFGLRDYDAQTGRWTSKDPLGFRGGDTNLYSYVSNDPVNWIDPLGLEKCQFSWDAWGDDIDEMRDINGELEDLHSELDYLEGKSPQSTFEKIVDTLDKLCSDEYYPGMGAQYAKEQIREKRMKQQGLRDVKEKISNLEARKAYLKDNAGYRGCGKSEADYDVEVGSDFTIVTGPTTIK